MKTIRFALAMALAAALGLASLAAHAGEAVGPVEYVHDGDTIGMAGERLRLADIDTPELDQPLGWEARAHLIDIIRDRDLVCGWEERERYGRALATCYPVGADGGALLVSVNAHMVRDGWAYAGLPYGYRLERAQSWAMAACRGLWAHAGLPWCHRRGER